MVKYHAGFCVQKLQIFDILSPPASDRLLPPEILQKAGTVGQQAKPFGFNELSVPRVSQVGTVWDKMGTFSGGQAFMRETDLVHWNARNAFQSDIWMAC